jgi:hypothetical protein
MSLAVDTFFLAYLVADDPESAEDLRGDFAALSEALGGAGHRAYTEPESRPPEAVAREHIGSFPYSWLHHLRRAYAHTVLDARRPLAPLDDGGDATADPAIEQVSSPRHHLLYHSDCEGYYVPIDFPTVIEDAGLPGIALGSSQQLLRELTLVAPTIGIPLERGVLTDDVAAAIAGEGQDVPFWIARQVWLTLHEHARISVAFGTALVFC